MKNAKCQKCLNKFHEKDIYTIQQFQYRKTPSYKWSIDFFKKLEITEWDSFCENCITAYSQMSYQAWENEKDK